MLAARRSIQMAMLPAAAWLFVAAMQLRFSGKDYRPHFSPPDIEILYFQVAFAWGALLCVASIIFVVHAWLNRRFDFLSLLVVCAALAFLFSWYPEAAFDGLHRRLVQHGFLR